jgi:hypothetical protein
MSQTIELSDESVALLKRQADAHSLTVDTWVQALAREKACMDYVYSGRQKAQAAAPRILEIQKRVKPDPMAGPSAITSTTTGSKWPISSSTHRSRPPSAFPINEQPMPMGSIRPSLVQWKPLRRARGLTKSATTLTR